MVRFWLALKDQLMTFGESTEPCAYVTLLSIGRLGVEENKRYSKAIMEALQTELGISPLKCFIFFNDYKAADVGYDKSTFDGVLWVSELFASTKTNFLDKNNILVFEGQNWINRNHF